MTVEQKSMIERRIFEHVSRGGALIGVSETLALEASVATEEVELVMIELIERHVLVYGALGCLILGNGHVTGMENIVASSPRRAAA